MEIATTELAAAITGTITFVSLVGGILFRMYAAKSVKIITEIGQLLEGMSKTLNDIVTIQADGVVNVAEIELIRADIKALQTAALAIQSEVQS